MFDSVESRWFRVRDWKLTHFFAVVFLNYRFTAVASFQKRPQKGEKAFFNPRISLRISYPELRIISRELELAATTRKLVLGSKSSAAGLNNSAGGIAQPAVPGTESF